MDISKVVYGDTTLIDLTEDTVTADSMLSGVTAHGANGEQIYGTMSQVTPATATPLMDGTAAVGTSIKYAREDHVHPHDSSIPTKVSDLTNDSGFIAAPSANVDEVIAYNGTTWVADKRMVILSYGSSTWTDFINAYNSNAVVYCKASSNSNPASGAQTRMAFMAYVNSDTPTNVEFQYYRSVSSHTDSQQGDQVFIYKLDKTAGWSVITRNSFTKIVAGTGLSSSYASQTLTLTNGLQPATAIPVMDGTAAVGISDKYAKEDHVHPLYDQFVRPNLLDNWYFVGGGSQQGGRQFPINQRGQTSYTGSAVYSLDRWFLQYDTNMQVLSAGTKISGKWDIKQKLKSLPSGIYTVSVLLSDYQSAPNIKIELFDSNGTSFAQSTTNNNGLITITMSSANAPATISLNLADSNGSSEATIIAIKLELGSTQTLAHQEYGTWVLNEIPDYEEQLIRCQTSTADSTDCYANQMVMTNQKVTNPNLLDNWYFVGGGSQQGGSQFPINSRGQTTYSVDGFTIDRWQTKNSSQTCSLNAAYLQIGYPANTQYLNFLTRLEEYITKSLAGKTVTASILLEEAATEWVTLGVEYTGGFKQASIDVRNTVFGSTSLTLDSNASGTLKFFVQNHTTNALTLKIKAVKLELGDTQTLAHQENGVWVLNEIPNYEEQLIHCKTSTASSSDIYASNNISYNTPNPNLLDNWYFVGGGSQLGDGVFPINQRGQTSYIAGYTIDRWKAGTAQTVATIYSDCIKIVNSEGVSSARIEQYLENSSRFWGRILTFSILGTNNELKTATFTMPSSAPQSSTTFASLQLTNGNQSLFRYSASLGIVCRITTETNTSLSTGVVAIKLELGNTQTLAHQENGVWVLNEIPNYEEQLIRCKTSTAYSYDTYANKKIAYDNLYFTSVAISATTGDIATVSDSHITSDHVVVNIVFANPSAVNDSVTWTTASGSLTLNGTCTTATTASIVLIMKNN